MLLLGEYLPIKDPISVCLSQYVIVDLVGYFIIRLF